MWVSKFGVIMVGKRVGSGQPVAEFAAALPGCYCRTFGNDYQTQLLWIKYNQTDLQLYLMQIFIRKHKLL